MARTLGEIEALARSQSSLSDEAEKASEKVLNLRGSIVDLTVGTKEHTKALNDLEKATKDEKVAKDEAKRVQLEYNAVVGDSAQSFKQLNQDIMNS